MSFNIIAGIIVLCSSYAFLLYLVFRSRKIIEIIEDRDLSSTREIIEKLHNGK